MSRKLVATMLALSLALGIFLIPTSGVCGDYDVWGWLMTQKTKAIEGLQYGWENPDTDMELGTGGYDPDNMMAVAEDRCGPGQGGGDAMMYPIKHVPDIGGVLLKISGE